MQTKKPLVSVLMLTYNHAPYLAQAIESVLSQQTEYSFELIICDDNSSDDTQKIAREYATKDPRIVLSFQPVNTKFGKNFADGCGKIRGTYVAFCEGDDYWTSPDKLQKQVAFLEANPDFSVAAHKVQMLEMWNGQPKTDPQYIYKDCRADEERIKQGIFYPDEAINNYYFQTGSLVLRWRFGDGLPHWFRKRMMFDHFMLMLHAVEGKIKYFDEAMSVWRRHGGGYTWLQTQDKGLFFQKEGDDWIRLYANMDVFFSGRFHPQIRQRILLALRSIASNCLASGNYDQLRDIVNKYQRYFNEVLPDAILVDAMRLAYPQKPEFAPPWQTLSSSGGNEAEENNAKPEKTAPAVGGLFPLAMTDIPACANSVWTAWTGDREYAGFYNLRSALMRLLWQKGVSLVWLPAYLPPMLEFNRLQCQFERKFYRINSKLEPYANFLDGVRPGEAVVTINYLGKPLPEDLAAKLAARKDIIWVRDMAQSLDPADERATAAIYSPRKLFGVPDGGILVGQGSGEISGWLENSNMASLEKRMPLLAASYEDDSKVGAKNLHAHKIDQEHQLSRHKMSRITEDMLRRIPIDVVAAKRKANWSALYSVLGVSCLWPIAEPDFTPYAFPFLTPQDYPLEILHTQLSKLAVFCQRMWYPLPVPNNLFPEEQTLSKRLLLLPCDQRYEKDDMLRIADKVNKILKETTN